MNVEEERREGSEYASLVGGSVGAQHATPCAARRIGEQGIGVQGNGSEHISPCAVRRIGE